MIPEAAVEAALAALFPDQETVSDFSRAVQVPSIRTILEAAAPHIAAQALRDAVDAFPLETITAPDNAVVWLMRRAERIRSQV